MSETKKNCTDWQTDVRCFKAGQPGAWELSARTIPEKDFCVAMPGYEDQPLGRPIDANLAVNFIQGFYKAVAAAHGPEKDSDVDGLEIGELKKLYMASRRFLESLSGINYGMTIDKNFALKILSQPKCEGLRGYLCFKDEPEAPISLITVGVDADGFDLNYNMPDTIKFQEKPDLNTVLPPINGTAQAVQNVEMRSLEGEYVTPPYTFQLPAFLPKAEMSGENKKFFSRFVLLNIATGNHDLLDFNNHSPSPGAVATEQ